MAAATICDGARAMYDALPAEVRPSEGVFFNALGIARDPPHVQRLALWRYAAMDKTRAGFNKDWGYMGCVKAARAHNNRAPTPQPQPRAPLLHLEHAAAVPRAEEAIVDALRRQERRNALPEIFVCAQYLWAEMVRRHDLY